jgi:cholesterol oxidase
MMEEGVRPDRHDVVVVGSGFGGAVSAYRLAKAGLDVCVLERGRAYPPGSFARSPSEMQDNFWDPSEGRHGLFDVWSFRGLDAVISSGLGGGSLIYANVLLRKDEHWFVEEDRTGPDGSYWEWPVTREDLDPHYECVEAMMGAQRFPFEHPDYAATGRPTAMRDAADRLGLQWQLPPLAVSFANPGQPPRRGEPLVEAPYKNLHDLPRTTCRMCGECDIGCNYGAKNTLDHTYLSAAADAGADIRTRADVRRIEPLEGGGWRVTYARHLAAYAGSPTDTRRLPAEQLDCRRLVVAAGTLGSTFLLLSNRSALPGISRTLGSRFNGNGDLLGILHSARLPNGRVRRVDASDGPVITSAIRLPDAADRRAGGTTWHGHERGGYVEDAGYPEFVNWLVETSRVPARLRLAARFGLKRLAAHVGVTMDTNWSAEIGGALGGVDFSASSMPLLGMGRDVPDGTMRLRGGRLDVDWTTKSSLDFFDRLGDTMAAMADALGARFEPNLLTRLSRVVTVHPLGGAPMGRHIGEGVVDDRGRVFGFDGLYVVDGAVMPGPVGANPALTIAAFADRAAEGILAEEGLA